MLYFGFGSNLCGEDLLLWCRTRGLAGIELTRLDPAFLPDRRLAFTHRSTTRGGGVLDAPPSRGCAVAGVLFRVRGHDAMACLDRKEGEGHAYRRIAIVALTEDGSEHTAFIYEVEHRGGEAFVAPSPAYLEVVRRGYEEHGVPIAPLVAAARGESHPGPVVEVFVYGGAAWTPGTLLDLGPYPGLALNGPPGSVAGELYAVPDPGALFAELDTVETFLGFGVPGSLYRRAIVPVRRADGTPTLAWTYVYAGPRDGSQVIASGDWRRTQERRLRRSRGPRLC